VSADVWTYICQPCSDAFLEKKPWQEDIERLRPSPQENENGIIEQDEEYHRRVSSRDDEDSEQNHIHPGSISNDVDQADLEKHCWWHTLVRISPKVQDDQRSAPSTSVEDRLRELAQDLASERRAAAEHRAQIAVLASVLKKWAPSDVLKELEGSMPGLQPTMVDGIASVLSGAQTGSEATLPEDQSPSSPA
jgi:hypothetical protein